MTDEPEDEKLPVKLTPSENLPAPRQPPLPHGVIDSAVSGFVAGMEARAIEQHTARVDAQTNLVAAHGELAKAFISTKKTIGALRDIDNILDEDQRERDHSRDLARVEREAKLAKAKWERDTAVLGQQVFKEASDDLREIHKKGIKQKAWQKAGERELGALAVEVGGYAINKDKNGNTMSVTPSEPEPAGVIGLRQERKNATAAHDGTPTNPPPQASRPNPSTPDPVAEVQRQIDDLERTFEQWTETGKPEAALRAIQDLIEEKHLELAKLKAPKMTP